MWSKKNKGVEMPSLIPIHENDNVSKMEKLKVFSGFSGTYMMSKLLK